MDVRNFRFERVLLEEPEHHRLTVLGSLPPSPDADPAPAILRLEKTAIPVSIAGRLFSTNAASPGYVSDAKTMEHTDIYMWLAAWLSPSSPDTLPQGDVKINVICPATEVHIRKYSPQSSTMLHETPKIYQSIVVPYIASIPPDRTNWVHEILSGQKEQSKILYTSPSFIILPDMKWDLHTLSSLYLVAISRDAAIKSLRDLRTHHIPLLKSIRREAGKVCKERWGLNTVDLRMFIHYHPSYYHFHVHIVNSAYEGGGGMRVGQAHLVDDVISLLELDVGNTPSLFERRTLVYGLGEQHGLYEAINAAQLMEQQH